MAKRRPKGSGSTPYRHKNGWQCYAHIPGQPRRYFSARSPVACEQARSEWLAERAAGRDPDAGKMTVAIVCERFLAHREATKQDAPRYLRSLRDEITHVLVPNLGGLPLNELTPGMVARLVAMRRATINERTGAVLSWQTATYARTVLSAVLTYAQGERWIVDNVARLAKVRDTGPPGTEYQPYTLEEARAIVRCAHPLQALWIVALTTGIRQGELLALTWPDVDLDRGVVHVPGTKTAAARGDVLLAPKTLRILKQHAKLRTSDEAYVFEWRGRDANNAPRAGEPLRARWVLTQWNDVVKRSQVGRYIDFRTATRTTAATLLAGDGVPDVVIQSVLRHTRRETTTDIYQKPDIALQHLATASMERMFGDDEAADGD